VSPAQELPCSHPAPRLVVHLLDHLRVLADRRPPWEGTAPAHARGRLSLHAVDPL